MYSGFNPYGCPLNPPWMLFILSPFALFSSTLGASLLAVLNLILFAFLLKRLSISPLLSMVFLSSPFVLGNSRVANFDALVLLGLLLPRRWGLFLLLSKPQIGIWIALYWIFEAWQEGKAKKVFQLIFPVYIAFMLSFVIYGPWPLVRYLSMSADHANVSIFPYSLPAGLLLLFYSFRIKSLPLILITTPLLTPYINFNSLLVPLLGLLMLLSSESFSLLPSQEYKNSA